jgi:hypothetical protein
MRMYGSAERTELNRADEIRVDLVDDLFIR